ncbi:MAG TPA: potassium transporter Kup [Gemmatimonadales bacterium]|nr:potassium transporter Kup [Gemmatimonadales bacterium]
MSHGTALSRRDLALLSFAALGVVYGDIGTSPLYAFEECFSGPHGVPVTHDNVLGVLSLIFWSLNFVVSFKYISIVLRADNRGEGGILALLALTRRSGTSKGIGLVMGVGLFGAALLYGDGIITPAISVLGAVEGLETLTPAFKEWVVPLAVVIITGLFFVQRRGTAGVGAIFGPVTTLWFICIAILGVMGIMREPAVLAAVNPMHAARFLATGGWDAFEVLAAVVLVVTGGEALYADMGHFGPRPIRIAWYAVVLPALVLNYFGQGALLLQDPTAASDPFYSLVPRWALIPMIAIATAAAIVASQALISGAYSLTQQAIQLGFSPRMRIVHTSEAAKGQIYMPEINAALWLACIGLVVTFRSAGALASTYGVAVTGTMFVTSILFIIVARERWQWPTWRVALVGSLFLVVDVAFLLANLLKIPSGGWFPLLVAGIVFLLMSTWKLGRKRLSAIVAENTLPFDLFLPDLGKRNLPRVPGTAVFMTSEPSGAPPVLLHHLKHNKVLHERVLIMSVASEEIPTVGDDERVTCEPLGQGFYLVKARYGFMETPDVPKVLALLPSELEEQGHHTSAFKVQDTSFYLGRETLIVGKKAMKADARFGRMLRWRRSLFALMSRNAQSATAFFQLPPNRVVELGAQIQF